MKQIIGKYLEYRMFCQFHLIWKNMHVLFPNITWSLRIIQFLTHSFTRPYQEMQNKKTITLYMEGGEISGRRVRHLLYADRKGGRLGDWACVRKWAHTHPSRGLVSDNIDWRCAHDNQVNHGYQSYSLRAAREIVTQHTSAWCGDVNATTTNNRH